jgi:hypothetical protein
MVLVAALLIATPAMAGLRHIRKEKLPQDQGVLKAYSDMLLIEEFVRQWSDTWRFTIPKSDVVSVAKASLGVLKDSVTSEPENVELLLLTGLVAHYAYNVDVEEAYELAVRSLDKARELARGEYRPEWFLGIHECQAGRVKEGMERLLAIERQFSWERLPAEYWDDYLSCAYAAGMPAHALRAGTLAKRLEANSSKDRDLLMGMAGRRFTAPDPEANYPAEAVWFAQETGSRVVFTNYMFGLAFASHGEWQVTVGGVEKGVCIVQIKTGPHPGKTVDVLPNILVLIRQPKPGETLDDFLKAALPGVSTNRTRVGACPSQECLFREGAKPGLYKSEGDGHVIMASFERHEPEFPGLVFEQPVALPPAPESQKVTYFRPSEHLGRVKGVLYYLVMLDTADSVLEKASKDYEDFLNGMRVE